MSSLTFLCLYFSDPLWFGGRRRSFFRSTGNFFRRLARGANTVYGKVKHHWKRVRLLKDRKSQRNRKSLNDKGKDNFKELEELIKGKFYRIMFLLTLFWLERGYKIVFPHSNIFLNDEELTNALILGLSDTCSAPRKAQPD